MSVSRCDDHLPPAHPTLQLLAYNSAVLRGTNVDQPRNLARSVTVEYASAATGRRRRLW